MVKKNAEYKGIQKKLVAAIAMVLVASIMVVTSSYAWFTLSTAPEVTGINTSVGSNGNLEIALRTGKLEDIGNSQGYTFPTANAYWGNLVDLSNEMYHLDDITLLPSALLAKQQSGAEYSYQKNAAGTYYVDKNGNDITDIDVKTAYKDLTQTQKEKLAADGVQIGYTAPVYNFDDLSYIKVPTYGADGRIADFNDNSFISTYQNDGFPATKNEGVYGVRGIGTSSNLSPAALALLNARKAVSGAKGTALNGAVTSLNTDAVKIANIAVKEKMNQKLLQEDIDNIGKAIANLQKVTISLEEAIRASVVALGVSQGMTIDPADVIDASGKIPEITVGAGENAQTLLWKLEANGKEGDTDYVAPEEAFDYTGYKTMLEDAYAKVQTMNGSLNGAKTALDAYTLGDGTNYDGLTSVATNIMNPRDILINGKAFSAYAIADLAGALLGGADISIVKGLYHDIALFVGNYSTPATLHVQGEYAGQNIDQDVTVNMGSDADQPAGGWYLDAAYAWLSGLKAKEPEGGSAEATIMSDLYAYAIDLAFRTNASGSNLLLQTEAKNRVEGSDATQGAGSYMEFTSGHATFTIYQMANLMKNVRVIFLDTDSTGTPILAVAGMDVDTHRVAINNEAVVQYANVSVTVTTEGEGEEAKQIVTVTVNENAEPMTATEFAEAFTSKGATAPTGDALEAYRIPEQMRWKVTLTEVKTIPEGGTVETVTDYDVKIDTSAYMTKEEFEKVFTDFDTTYPDLGVEVPAGEALEEYLAWEQATDAKGAKLYLDDLGNLTTSATGNTAVYDIPNYTIVDAAEKTIRAELRLCEFEIVNGELAVGEPLAKQTITALTQNVAKGITAMVYLDGNQVQNADVAIGGNSMTGTLNLQFASDAVLDPMDYTFGEKLPAPTAEIGADGKTLTITRAENDDKTEKFKIAVGPATVEAAVGDDGTATFDLSTLPAEVPDGTYKIEIVAAAQGYVDSNKVVVEYTKTTSPVTP